MPIKFCIFVVFALYMSTISLNAQQLLKLDLVNVCPLPNTLSDDALYGDDSSNIVMPMIRQILDKAQLPMKFVAINTNVQGVVAVITKEKRYLLYDHEFFYEHRNAKHICYALLAASIHHVTNAKHTCALKNQKREESEAWEFAGRALQAQGFPLEIAAKVSDFQGNASVLKPEERKKQIEAGWNRADAFLQSQKSAGYLGNKTNLEKLPLPEFDLPAPDCAARREYKPAYIQAPKTLADANAYLINGLDRKGYEQRSYFYVPNGFALVTQLEQCKMDGTPLNGADRWKDYPVPEKFDDIWGYFKSLVLPQKARFRFFVFLVTDQNISLTSNRSLANTDQVRDWLQKGGSSLPPVMEKWKFSALHKMTILVYELVGNGNENGTIKKCPADQISVHLKGSGLDKTLPEKK